VTTEDPIKTTQKTITFPPETHLLRRVRDLVEIYNDERDPGDPALTINDWILIAIERQARIQERRRNR